MTVMKINSIAWMRDDTEDEEESLVYPDFLVEGTLDGQPFRLKVGVELDGRDCDFETLEGSIDMYVDHVDLQGQLFDELHQSQAYKDACVAADI